MRQIDYLIADPAGNITILVLSPADRSEYAGIASALLERHHEAEQVAFVLPPQQPPAMEMCGLEFCGNASRAFAYYVAQLSQPPLKEVSVSVSGTADPLPAYIDVPGNMAKIQMPLPSGAEEVSIEISSGREISGTLVYMDGIAHLVIGQNQEGTEEEELRQLFCEIRDEVYRREREKTGTDLPAFGIMFLDPQTRRMRPVVYVRDVNTIYFEGSCASGSSAAAYALALATGENSFTLKQPAGELMVETERSQNGEVARMLLSGSMKLSEAYHMELG